MQVVSSVPVVGQDVPQQNSLSGKLPFCPSLDELRKRVFAVHATNYLPEEGRLFARAAPDKKSSVPLHRVGVHYALGELVRAASVVSWDDHCYAILTPLKELEGRIATLWPYETIALGNQTLNRESTIVVPIGIDTTKIEKIARIYLYDKSTTSLRAAVDEAIEQRGGWHILGQENGWLYQLKWSVNGQEVDYSRFFQSFFDKHPYVSYGNPMIAESGEASCLFAMERLLRGMDTSNKKLFCFLEKLFQIMRGKVERYGDFEATREATRWVEGRLQELARQPEDKGCPAFDQRVLACLQKEELQGLVEHNRSQLVGINIDELYARYAIVRWLHIGSPNATREGLHHFLSQKIKSVPTNQGDVLWIELSSFLNVQSMRLADALDIVNLEPVKRHFLVTQRLELDPKRQWTLQDVLRGHPETKGSFTFKLSEAGGIMCQIMIETGLSKQYPLVFQELPKGTSFADAKEKKSQQDQLKKLLIATFCVPIAKGIAEKGTWGESIPPLSHLKSDSPSTFFAKLGLLAQYEKLFPSSDAFFSSEKTLWQILLQLESC